MFEKEQTFLKNTELQFKTIEKALLKAKKEGKKTITLDKAIFKEENLSKEQKEDLI